jgi:uncharacterized protein (UPF0333 family)
MNHSFSFSSSRGQASLEFVLVLIFMLVIMSAVIVPLGQRSQNALEDVSKAGFARSGLSHIEYTISNMLLVPGDSRQIIDIYLPEGTIFSCDPVLNDVNITFPLNRDVFEITGAVPSECVDNIAPNTPPEMVCSKTFDFPSYADLHCQGDPNNGYDVSTGQNGFTQRFNIRSYYVPGPIISYEVDFNAV